VTRKGDSTKRLRQIEEAAERILAGDPDPVVRFRILRDVLALPSDAPQTASARRSLKDSLWVRELETEQREDGGWGRFHSQDTGTKQKIPTTEVGVDRALAVGLDASHLVLRRASPYIAAILIGKIGFPDPPEKNDRWPTGAQLFAASTLAKIEPDSRALDDVWGFWAEIARRTFASGGYNPQAEVQAHRELTGNRVSDLRYLVLSGRYQLALLGARSRALPPGVERSLVEWIWRREEGIGYLGTPLSRPPDRPGKLAVEGWFSSLELLSHFPSWRKRARGAIDWLWAQRDGEGLWDFGPRSSWSFYFPLSESWRRRRARQHDWSIRVLALLRRYHC
jgi:hypothetical protein